MPYGMASNAVCEHENKSLASGSVGRLKELHCWVVVSVNVANRCILLLSSITVLAKSPWRTHEFSNLRRILSLNLNSAYQFRLHALSAISSVVSYWNHNYRNAKSEAVMDLSRKTKSNESAICLLRTRCCFRFVAFLELWLQVFFWEYLGPFMIYPLFQCCREDVYGRQFTPCLAQVELVP